MVHDQDQPKYGNTSGGGGGGGKVLKKQKQRKIPQRGLGVAQLEKIRLEELHKNEGGGATPPPPPPPPPLIFPLPQQQQHYHHSSIHDVGSSLRTALRSNLLPVASPLLHRTGGYSPISNNLSDYKFSFGGGVGSSSSMQENYSSKMNVARSISSGLNLQIEPPSNQSYNSNYNYRHPPPPLLLEDDKVGMKRTYPFSLDQPPPLHCKIPGLENAGAFNLEPGNSNLREGSSHQFDRRAGLKNGHKDQFDWRSGFPEFNLRNGNKENEPLDTALTLGLPTSSLPTMTNKAKHPLEFPASSWYQECSNINASSQQQEIFMGDPLFRRGESIQSQRVYDFFPPKPQQNGHLAASSSGERSGISDPLDLDLKL